MAGGATANGLDDNPFITARHIDNLTDAVNGLTRMMSTFTVVQRDILKATNELTSVIKGAGRRWRGDEKEKGGK